MNSLHAYQLAPNLVAVQHLGQPQTSAPQSALLVMRARQGVKTPTKKKMSLCHAPGEDRVTSVLPSQPLRQVCFLCSPRSWQNIDTPQTGIFNKGAVYLQYCWQYSLECYSQELECSVVCSAAESESVVFVCLSWPCKEETYTLVSTC